MQATEEKTEEVQSPSSNRGSVKQAPYFNPEKDATVLYGNLRGLANDENAIISIISARTNIQRQEVSRSYLSVYGRDLPKDLKAETTGDFQNIVVALMLTPTEFDAACLYKAMKGLGTDEKALTEILVSRSKKEIKKIKNIYKEKYGHELTQDINDDVAGDFLKLLVKLASGSRDDWNGVVDSDKAKEDAKQLCRIKHSHELSPCVLEIFCTRSFPHLCAAFSEYEKLSHRDILKTISSEFGGDLKDALKTIVVVARHPHEYFAERLYRSMKGAGTDDSTLIRVVVSRSEIDMLDIKRFFEEKHGKSLEKFIEGDTSGSYKKLLLAIVSS